ncbi:MAG: trigger factor [Gammaproteobacteria bacterium]|nr:MAG: trigger factor [Gammaproteobacteria bacterium]
MQISIETTSGLERRLTISVPSETFEEQITDRLGQAAGQVRLPGFRPGKVPMREVRRRFGPAVRAEVAGELMQSSFVEAVQQESLSPAGSPSLEVVKMDPGIDFEFTATFEVFPVVELTDLTRVSVKRAEAEITDEDLAEMIDRLREQRKDWTKVERGAQEGDKVSLDFVGKIDDEAFEGGSGEDVSFEVGAGQMIEDFDQGVRGLAEGDTGEFAATFPDDYGSEDLQGKTATFSVTIKAVEEPTVPELDDEFFKTFGVEEGGLEAFHAEVRSNMQRELDAAVANQVKSQVMDELHRLHSVQLPQAMVSQEIQNQKQQMLQQFQMYGQGGQAPDIDLPDDLFTEQAQKRVSVGLIVNEVVTSGELKADEEKVKARVEELAAGYADPSQVVSYYYSNPEQLQQIEMAVLEDQVVDHILEQAAVEVVSTTYQDALTGAAIAPEPEEAPEQAADSEASARADDENTPEGDKS